MPMKAGERGMNVNEDKIERGRRKRRE